MGSGIASTAPCWLQLCFGASGTPPLILELLPNERDDDHIIALFRVEGYWGAVAKSNFVGLRFRDPAYRNLRELVLSYFESYYNVEREKTLRGYTCPLDLSRFDSAGWTVNDTALDSVADALDRSRRYTLLPAAVERSLAKVDQRTYDAGLLGAREDGLWKPD